MGHAPAEITGNAKTTGMSTEVTTEGAGSYVLVHNTVGTGFACRVHASRDERELDQERRRAPGGEVDRGIVTIERVSVFVAEGERLRNYANRVKMGHSPAEDATSSSHVDRGLGVGSRVGPASTYTGL